MLQASSRVSIVRLRASRSWRPWKAYPSSPTSELVDNYMPSTSLLRTLNLVPYALDLAWLNKRS